LGPKVTSNINAKKKINKQMQQYILKINASFTPNLDPFSVKGLDLKKFLKDSPILLKKIL
jgi:hypothetical protein